MNIDSIVVIVSYIGNAIFFWCYLGNCQAEFNEEVCPKLWKFNTGEFSKRQKIKLNQFYLNLIEFSNSKSIPIITHIYSCKFKLNIQWEILLEISEHLEKNKGM